MILNTNQLILKALENGLGHDKFEVKSIQCLDTHLYGHAFKYYEESKNIIGVYPYKIDYVDTSGENHTAQVMVKAKPDQGSIIRVYQNLLDQCGIKLKCGLSDLLKNSDYWTPNLKEAVLFRDFEQELKPYIPRSLGVYIEDTASYTLRLEEKLPPGSVILDPDDDTTDRWDPSFFELTLNAIANIPARFCNNYKALSDTGYFFVCDMKVMNQASELWKAFYHFLNASYGEVMNQDFARSHQAILVTLAYWYSLVDKQPKTLLYGDVNPQNLAFAKTGDGFQLSVFDWERAVISLPQRDLAEHLIYTLPDGFSKQEALEQIEVYRTTFAQKSAVKIDKDAFYQGLVWMLYDLIVNRLPLMMIVKKVAKKRCHSTNAYTNAHMLLYYLS